MNIQVKIFKNIQTQYWKSTPNQAVSVKLKRTKSIQTEDGIFLKVDTKGKEITNYTIGGTERDILVESILLQDNNTSNAQAGFTKYK